MSSPFPTSPAPSEVLQKTKHYNVQSEALSGRIQVRSLNNSRREWRISYPLMSRSEFSAVSDFLDTLQGSFGTFTINVPDPSSLDTFDFSTGSGCMNVTARLKNDIQEFSIGIQGMYEYELDIVEVI